MTKHLHIAALYYKTVLSAYQKLHSKKHEKAAHDRIFILL